MELFDVYPLYPVTPVKALGDVLWDEAGTQYLDLYGGHAVISVGHSHPHYIKRLTEQLNKIAFYSNSVQNPLQTQLANLLGKVSGYNDYKLFLCSSGAEANENALKLASFTNKRKTVVAFSKSFHGRTSLAVAATDNPKIVAPVNATDNVKFLPFNDVDALKAYFMHAGESISSVIIEGIQGVGGINVASPEFLTAIRNLCDTYGAYFIADSVQCGYGRSGKFFSHDYSEVKADIYTLAKGMGNGFPVAGIIVSPKFEAQHGMLGTTFGGNHLACAAALAVLEIMESENLMQRATEMGAYLTGELKAIPGVTDVRGYGLMIGADFEFPIKDLRNNLIFKHKIFTGNSSNPNNLRILPALTVKKEHLDKLLESIKQEVSVLS